MPNSVDLDALRKVTEGDAEFEKDLIDTFIASGDQSLADILAALELDDFATIGERAHSLKGSSASIFADGVRNVAAALELTAKAEVPGNVAALVDELSMRLAEVTQQLRVAR